MAIVSGVLDRQTDEVPSLVHIISYIISLLAR